MAVDMDKLQEFLGRFVTDLGATFTAGNVVTGHRLGLYRALAAGPAPAAELAQRTSTTPGMSLSGSGPGSRRLRGVRPGHRHLLDDRGAGVRPRRPGRRRLHPGAFVLALGTLKAEPRITEAFRTGAGMGWHEHDRDVFTGCEQFFRPGYTANLDPVLDPGARRCTGQAPGRRQGRRHRLRARRLDPPHGPGLPDSRFPGSDYHASRSSRAQARRRRRRRRPDQLRGRLRGRFLRHGYDLATTFDCLHDMGDPLGAARHVRQALKPDGTWLVVEPYAADEVAENLNPVGRVYYNASTLLCVPNALSQPGGYALGAQAGEAAIRQVTADAGFTRFRRAAETPFNLVYEVRP